MSLTTMGVVRRLARSFTYQELTEIIGRKVLVSSIETAPSDCSVCLPESLREEIGFEGPGDRYPAGAVSKYGILDLTYNCAPLPHRGWRQAIADLREQNLLEEGAGPDEEGLGYLLDHYVPEVESNRGLVRLLLEMEAPPPRREGRFHPHWPTSFIVKDAALTNMQSVWLFSHFYL